MSQIVTQVSDLSDLSFGLQNFNPMMFLYLKEGTDLQMFFKIKIKVTLVFA